MGEGTSEFLTPRVPALVSADATAKQANDNSGYIGAAIVGSFVAIVAIWYASRWAWRKLRARHVSI